MGSERRTSILTYLSVCGSVCLSPSPRASLHLGLDPLGHPREVMGEDSVSVPGQLQRGGVFPPEGPLGSPPPHRCIPACLISSPHETKIFWVVRFFWVAWGFFSEKPQPR